MGGVGQLLGQLAAVLPWWAWVVAAVPALYFAVPGYLYSMRNRQVRGLVRRMVRADYADRDRLVQEALARAADDPHLIVVIVREARRHALPIQAEAALRRLRALPGAAPLLAELEGTAKRTPTGDPEAELASVTALLAEGLDVVARARLAAARAAFPAHAGLTDLAEKIGLDTGPSDVYSAPR